MIKNQNLILKILIIGFALIFSSKVQAQSLTEYYKAVAEESYGNYQLALKHINNAIEKNKTDAVFFIEKGKILMQLQQNNIAITCFRLAVDEGSYEANLYLAKLYAGLNNTDSSVYFLKKYLRWHRKKMKYQITSDSDFINLKNTPQWQELWAKNYYPPYLMEYQEAYYSYRYNDQIEALSEINDVIKKYKNFALAYALKAKILAEGKNYKQSIKFYSKAIKLDPQNENFYLERANSYYKNRNYKKAITDLQKYKDLDKYNPKIFYLLAQYQYAIKDYDNALENISKYCNVFYKDSAAEFKMAEIAYDAGEYLRTIQIINSLSKGKHMTAEYFRLRGQAYYQTGNYDLAFYDLSQALDINPTIKDVYYFRGLTAYKSGKKQEACSDWKKAMDERDYRPYNLYYDNCQ